MAISAGQLQRQTAGMSPEHLLGKSVLKMGLQELQEFVMTELAENPALVIDEEAVCVVCGSIMGEGLCPTCGATQVTDEDVERREADEWPDADKWTEPVADDEELEPFAFVAAPSSLTEHLKQQIRTSFSGESGEIAEFIVDCLEDDGYLREPLLDIAGRFGLSVPQLEDVLARVQSLDPPGIAARTLQECMLIQLRQIEESPERRHAEVILTEHWESLAKLKIDEIARRMDVPRDDVECALLFIRQHLNPYPANQFRDPWQKLAPRKDARLAPDVVIRETETGLTADVVDPISGRISMDDIYSSLYADMTRKKNGHSEEDKQKVKESVHSAKSLIEALEFRRSSLRKVAEHLLSCQFEFFKSGPEHLKPINRKQLSEQIGLHESTVCRATDGKRIQLPTGEIIPFELLFDPALPVKELVRKYAAERVNGKPLSDGEIAERLQANGIQIARRTVAKYREQMKVLSADLRLG